MAEQVKVIISAPEVRLVPSSVHVDGTRAPQPLYCFVEGARTMLPESFAWSSANRRKERTSQSAAGHSEGGAD